MREFARLIYRTPRVLRDPRVKIFPPESEAMPVTRAEYADNFRAGAVEDAGKCSYFGVPVAAVGARS